jgi:hypothetical protein
VEWEGTDLPMKMIGGGSAAVEVKKTTIVGGCGCWDRRRKGASERSVRLLVESSAGAEETGIRTQTGEHRGTFGLSRGTCRRLPLQRPSSDLRLDLDANLRSIDVSGERVVPRPT